MIRAVMLRVAAISTLIAALVVTSSSAASADGAMGLNGPTGEPLPWTLAILVGLAGVAFVARAVVKLRRRGARLAAAEVAAAVATPPGTPVVSPPTPAPVG